CGPRGEEAREQPAGSYCGEAAPLPTRAAGFRMAGPKFVVRDVSASAISGSPARSTAPLAGFRRQPSDHVAMSDSDVRAYSPDMAALENSSRSEALPLNMTGGVSRFLSASLSRVASMKPIVAVLQVAPVIVTFWSVIRSPAKIGRGVAGRTPAAVQSTCRVPGWVSTSPYSSLIRWLS